MGISMPLVVNAHPAVRDVPKKSVSQPNVPQTNAVVGVNTMANRGRWVLSEKTGEWREGKAAPQQLPENLAALPSEKVTKDEDDPDKAHSLDPDHVVDHFAEQVTSEELTAKAAPRTFEDPEKEAADVRRKRFEEFLEFVPTGKSASITQKRVDGVRYRVLMSLINRMNTLYKAGVSLEGFPILWHLKFPHDDVQVYELKRGQPPARMLRPRWTKNIDLEIDINCWPQRIRDALAAIGLPTPDKFMTKQLQEHVDASKPGVEGADSDVSEGGGLPGLPDPRGTASRNML